MEFLVELLKVFDSNIGNDHKDNWDYDRYGPEPKDSLRQKAVAFVKGKLSRNGYFNLHYFLKYDLKEAIKFKYLFDHLETDEDRMLLLQVIAYKLLGHRKVKLPLNTPEYWSKLNHLKSICDKSDSINPQFLHFSLYKINLEKMGYPIQLYFTAGGIMTDFIIKQYEYNKEGTIIKAEKGDVVIDGGGCWGDTAISFAHEAGRDGKVFSFEFIPNNISIFEKNVSLNGYMKDVVELVRRPLWKDSSTKVNFKDFGPGSRVSTEEIEDKDGECYTMSIDDLVQEKGLKKVDFIKMDIEGAEPLALTGAVQTIKRFKPKLAIALYHSFEDFDRIPRMIREMVPEYKFYFSHSTIFGEESMLFAKTD